MRSGRVVDLGCRLYRRADETHGLRLYAAGEVLGALRVAGFRARVVRAYGALRLPRARAGFVARKPWPPRSDTMPGSFRGGESLPSGASKRRDAGQALEDRLLEAVERALAGDWPAAHVIVQAHEDDARAAWIHAVVHRMEGDLANARYWYRRCGRSLREGVATDAELREIRDELLREEPGE